MASWEPLITDDQYEAWMNSFHIRYGGSPFEILNGIVIAGNAAYAEAYGAWLAHHERAQLEAGNL